MPATSLQRVRPRDRGDFTRSYGNNLGKIIDP
jgi:hypothetical protein